MPTKLFAHLPIHVARGSYVPTDANLVHSVQESARRPSCMCRFFLVIIMIVAALLAGRIIDSLNEAEHDQATYATGSPPPPQTALVSLLHAPPSRA